MLSGHTSQNLVPGITGSGSKHTDTHSNTSYPAQFVDTWLFTLRCRKHLHKHLTQIPNQTALNLRQPQTCARTNKHTLARILTAEFLPFAPRFVWHFSHPHLRANIISPPTPMLVVHWQGHPNQNKQARQGHLNGAPSGPLSQHFTLALESHFSKVFKL